MSPYQSPSSYVTGYVRPAPPPAFQLSDFLRIVEARRGLILRVALGTIVLATLVALLLPRQYSSSAVVMLDQRKNNVTDLSSVLSQLPTDPAAVQNQIQILTSRKIASDVITKLKLSNDPEFNPVLAPPGWAGMLRWGQWFAAPANQDASLIRDRILTNFLKHVSAEANGLRSEKTKREMRCGAGTQKTHNCCYQTLLLRPERFRNLWTDADKRSTGLAVEITNPRGRRQRHDASAQGRTPNTSRCTPSTRTTRRSRTWKRRN